MQYSVFDDKTGLYDYYVGSGDVPINADLPTPRMPGSAGKVGVASIEAARPLPGDARHVGRGWHAKGVLARKSGGLAGAGTPGEAWTWVKDGGWKWIAGGLAVIWLARRI
jgi:hypothetical protein